MYSESKTRKDFFNQCRNFYQITQKEVQATYNLCIADTIDEIAINDKFVDRISFLRNVPNLITQKAQDFLEQHELPEHPLSDMIKDPSYPQFSVKRVQLKTDGKTVSCFVFPYIAGSSKAISKMEGTIIHESEVPYYPIENVCTFSKSSNLFFVDRMHFLQQSNFYNSCLTLLKESNGYAVYLHKPSHVVNPFTGRLIKSTVKRGSVVLIPLTNDLLKK